MKFLYCFLYLIIVSIIVFLIGRILPRNWINENCFLFKSFKRFKGSNPIFSKSLQNYTFFLKPANFLYICYFCFTKKYIFLSFSPEVCWNLTPLFRLPFVNRCCPRIFVQPFFCSTHRKQEVLILYTPLQFGLALLLSYP